jgi:hypothetical protein
VCRGLDHLRAELARVEGLGGEGLMVRRPGSRYEVGRSTTLLKIKSFRDAEARVLEHLKGAGRHKGRLGALLVELADGTRFSVGTGFSDAQRAAPPPVGSLITFRYQELSEGGVPRFPSFVGLRDDVAWPPAGADVAPPSSAAAASSSPAAGQTTPRGARYPRRSGGSSWSRATRARRPPAAARSGPRGRSAPRRRGWRRRGTYSPKARRGSRRQQVDALDGVAIVLQPLAGDTSCWSSRGHPTARAGRPPRLDPVPRRAGGATNCASCRSSLVQLPRPAGPPSLDHSG